MVNLFKSISNYLRSFDFKNEKKENYYSSISFINEPKFFGGPGTFQKNLTSKLKQKNFLIRYKNDNIKTDYFIIIGSSLRSFLWLLKMKLSGSKMIHRIDGAKWQYKYKGKIKVKVQKTYFPVTTSSICHFHFVDFVTSIKAKLKRNR